jgi:hypothetical protein
MFGLMHLGLKARAKVTVRDRIKMASLMHRTKWVSELSTALTLPLTLPHNPDPDPDPDPNPRA